MITAGARFLWRPAILPGWARGRAVCKVSAPRRRGLPQGARLARRDCVCGDCVQIGCSRTQLALCGAGARLVCPHGTRDAGAGGIRRYFRVRRKVPHVAPAEPGSRRRVRVRRTRLALRRSRHVLVGPCLALGAVSRQTRAALWANALTIRRACRALRRELARVARDARGREARAHCARVCVHATLCAIPGTGTPRERLERTCRAVCACRRRVCSECARCALDTRCIALRTVLRARSPRGAHGAGGFTTPAVRPILACCALHARRPFDLVLTRDTKFAGHEAPASRPLRRLPTRGARGALRSAGVGIGPVRARQALCLFRRTGQCVVRSRGTL